MQWGYIIPLLLFCLLIYLSIDGWVKGKTVSQVHGHHASWFLVFIVLIGTLASIVREFLGG